MNFLEKLQDLKHRNIMPPTIVGTLFEFYLTYKKALETRNMSIETVSTLLDTFLDLVVEQIQNPYKFSYYHSSIRKPFDYYQFGLDFLRPLVLFEHSKVLGIDNINLVETYLAKNENVIFFSNHQTEPDPQAISLLLENSHPSFAENMIFVAGHRVTSDPLAIPFSLGRNLLCIFSKKHIEHLPEEKMARLNHNKKVMQTMEALLKEGGKCIYVAPSGGRDRANASGNIELAPFDAQSIEMFYLIAKRAKTPTHFFPLSLATYALLPPPNSIKKDLGETRFTNATPIHLYFGNELHDISKVENFDKNTIKSIRASQIYDIVKKNYDTLTSG